ncbi:MAG: hypothetical protein P4L51_13130, partial [Puia sp.]|nr:hypothetical protein [Puia sp.]
PQNPKTPKPQNPEPFPPRHHNNPSSNTLNLRAFHREIMHILIFSFLGRKYNGRLAPPVPQIRASAQRHRRNQKPYREHGSTDIFLYAVVAGRSIPSVSS